MKKSIFFLLVFIGSLFSYGQVISTVHEIHNVNFHSSVGMRISESKFVSLEFPKTECMTDLQRSQLFMEIKANKAIILQKNPNAFNSLKPQLTAFVTPFRARADFDDYGYHTVNFQVDHNLTPNNNLLDYNCGIRSYDWASGNHQGTDYILWPYAWRRMSENTMEVVAAADGVIVNKRDGYYDLSCANAGNPNWNGFVLEHADGSQTIYMHFKKNTLNPKEIGETVTAGEYLGVAGSSGSSNWPHLHFEVRAVGDVLVDPYAGPCNSMNTESWWQVQEPYKVFRINNIGTHSEPTEDTECPVIENTYTKLDFLPGETVFLKLYYRDIQEGDTTHIKVSKPDGSILYEYDWVCDWSGFFPTSYAYWSFPTDNSWMDGVYTVEATAGGSTYQTIFGINTNLGTEEILPTQFTLYPNPSHDVLNIHSARIIAQTDVVDFDGRILIQQKFNSKNIQLNIQDLPKGVYLVRIHSGNKVEIKKFIKN